MLPPLLPPPPLLLSGAALGAEVVGTAMGSRVGLGVLPAVGDIVAKPLGLNDSPVGLLVGEVVDGAVVLGTELGDKLGLPVAGLPFALPLLLPFELPLLFPFAFPFAFPLLLPFSPFSISNKVGPKELAAELDTPVGNTGLRLEIGIVAGAVAGVPDCV